MTGEGTADILFWKLRINCVLPTPSAPLGVNFSSLCNTPHRGKICSHSESAATKSSTDREVEIPGQGGGKLVGGERPEEPSSYLRAGAAQDSWAVLSPSLDLSVTLYIP